MGCAGSKDIPPAAPEQQLPQPPSSPQPPSLPEDARSPNTVHRHEQALLNAAEAGNEPGCRAAIALGAELTCTDWSGFTPLHLASAAGHLTVAKKLLSYNAPFNAVNKEGNTPLHLAAANGHLSVADVLLESDADLSLKNADGKTALQVAKEGVNHDMISLLQRAHQVESPDREAPVFELQLPTGGLGLGLNLGGTPGDALGLEIADDSAAPMRSRLDKRRNRFKRSSNSNSDPADGEERAVLDCSSAPAELLCKLHNTLLYDPVKAADGELYERVAMQKWFERRNTTSPATREKLGSQKLIAQPETRAAVRAWLHGVAKQGHRAIPWEDLNIESVIAPCSMGEQAAHRQCVEASWAGFPVCIERPAPGAEAMVLGMPVEDLCSLSEGNGLVSIFGSTFDPDSRERCYVCEKAKCSLAMLLSKSKRNGCPAGLGARLMIVEAIVAAAQAVAQLKGTVVCLHNLLVLECDEDELAMDTLQQCELSLADFGWKLPEASGTQALQQAVSARGPDSARSGRLSERGSAAVRDGKALSARSATPRSLLTVSNLTRIRWQPPEAMRGEWDNDKSLVWSVGITLWQVFADGKLPFREVKHEDAVVMKISNGNRPSQPKSCPSTVYRLIQRCWANSTANRPTLEELSKQLKALDLMSLRLELEEDDISSSEEFSDSEEEQQGTSIMAFPTNL